MVSYYWLLYVCFVLTSGCWHQGRPSGKSLELWQGILLGYSYDLSWLTGLRTWLFPKIDIFAVSHNEQWSRSGFCFRPLQSFFVRVFKETVSLHVAHPVEMSYCVNDTLVCHSLWNVSSPDIIVTNVDKYSMFEFITIGVKCCCWYTKSTRCM